MSLYKTILVTLEGTPTDRAIINHIKLLAPAMQSRVVLLHVASGVAAQYHRTDAAGTEVEPLPFHGMRDQIYGQEKRPQFPSDALHRKYNTRWVEGKVLRQTATR